MSKLLETVDVWHLLIMAPYLWSDWLQGMPLQTLDTVNPEVCTARCCKMPSLVSSNLIYFEIARPRRHARGLGSAHILNAPTINDDIVVFIRTS